MGETYTGGIETVTAPGWAAFTADIPGGSVLSYVPVINVYPPSLERVDAGEMNTYGCDIKSVAAGDLDVSVNTDFDKDDYPLMSDYSWIGDGETGIEGRRYAYYNIWLKFDGLNIPEGYEIYKVRAWRKIDPSLLGEVLKTRRDVRKTDDGEYLFEELKFNDAIANGTGVMTKSNLLYGSDGNVKSYDLGSRKAEGVFATDETPWSYGENQEAAVRNELRSTFGALRLKTSPTDEKGEIDNLEAEFIVRVYYTSTANPVVIAPSGTPRRAPSASDLNIYVAEGKATFNAQNLTEIITGVVSPLDAKPVVGVMYYNMMGVASSRPFAGVNIVVTRYSDGSVTTAKVVR